MKKITLLLAVVFSSKLFAQLCDPNSSSILFNGNSSNVNLGTASSAMPDSAITIEAWIKPAAFSANVWQNSIVNRDGWSPSEEGFSLRCGGNGVLSFVICGRTYASAASLSWKEVKSPVASLPLNTWSHVAGVFDGDTLRCFVNGVQKATFAFTGMIRWSSTAPIYNLMLGRCPQGLTSSTENRYFNGNIDEVRIWERALSASELQANMNNHINIAGQNRLIAYAQLNENTGTTVNYFSNSSVTGTVNSATWSSSVPFAGGLQLTGVTGNFNSSPLTTETYVVTPSNLQGYAWTVGNGTIVSGQNNDTVTVVWVGSGSGTLTVVGTDSTCADTLVNTITITPTAIQAIEKANTSIRVAQSNEKISFMNRSNNLVNVSVYNSIGMQLKNIRIAANTNVDLPLEELPMGVYIYSCQSENEKNITGKFIKR
jgi:hypothetical protein